MQYEISPAISVKSLLKSGREMGVSRLKPYNHILQLHDLEPIGKLTANRIFQVMEEEAGSDKFFTDHLHRMATSTHPVLPNIVGQDNLALSSMCRYLLVYSSTIANPNLSIACDGTSLRLSHTHARKDLVGKYSDLNMIIFLQLMMRYAGLKPSSMTLKLPLGGRFYGGDKPCLEHAEFDGDAFEFTINGPDGSTASPGAGCLGKRIGVIRQVQGALNSLPFECLNVEQLSLMLGCSRRHLEIVLRQHGTTPLKMVNAAIFSRIQQAVVRHNWNVKAVMHEFGIRSQSSVTKRFVHASGMTFKEYKEWWMNPGGKPLGENHLFSPV
ncbi:helix-turn-helix domain-containing protein [Ferrimonas sp.]|uniref:helix-turn-helix domain-containing protein n=1 Tax=Ferrimonas sp. TaxID=2080861 RepID=UPI003A8DBFEC